MAKKDAWEEAQERIRQYADLEGSDLYGDNAFPLWDLSTLKDYEPDTPPEARPEAGR